MMDEFINIFIPIISSCVGGFIGGYFTFLGVRLTIHNTNKIHKEEMDLKEKDNLEKIKKINQVINKKMIVNRPEFRIVKQDMKNIEKSVSIYVLPYSIKASLSIDNIMFNYDRDELLKTSNWECFKIILQNTGKTEIDRGFIQLPYKSGLNMYQFNEFNNIYFNNHYSDNCGLHINIAPNESFVLNIFCFKKFDIFPHLDFNIYFADKNNNYWLQEFFGGSCTQNSRAVSPIEYIEHYNSNINETFIYAHMFFDDKNVEKKLYPIKDEYKFLQDKKEKAWSSIREMDDFNDKLKNNEISLNEPSIYLSD